MTTQNPTEESLQELINSNKNKSVVISGKKYFIGKHVKEQVKEHIGTYSIEHIVYSIEHIVYIVYSI